MPFSQVRNVNFGWTRGYATGSSGVGYTLLDSNGNIIQQRTTDGVYESVEGSGIYAANMLVPEGFRGQIIWDTGSHFTKKYFATEQYNVEENDPRVGETWQMVSSITGSVQFIRDMTAGRWKIEGNQMKFYAEDNVTLIAAFNLYDNNGTPSIDAVFERVKV